MKKKLDKGKKPVQGLYWHCHHTQTVEFCYDYWERRRYIAEEKRPEERPLRLKLFKPVTTKGASAKLKKFIEGCKTLESINGYSQPMHELARELGYKNNSVALADVLKLHRKQCHPRCPVMGRGMYSSILKHKNNKGIYTLRPVSHALQGK